MTKNPYECIQAFMKHCEIINHKGMLGDAFRMHLFPHALKDGAQKWLHSLLLRSIILWNNMVGKFILKFFFLFWDHRIRIEIHTFNQNDHKSCLKVWERFKNYFKKCSNLDILNMPIDNFLSLLENCRKTVYLTNWKGNNGYSQHWCCYSIDHSNRSIRKEIGQPNSEYEHSAPTSTSLQGLRDKSYHSYVQNS